MTTLQLLIEKFPDCGWRTLMWNSVRTTPEVLNATLDDLYENWNVTRLCYKTHLGITNARRLREGIEQAWKDQAKSICPWCKQNIK